MLGSLANLLWVVQDITEASLPGRRTPAMEGGAGISTPSSTKGYPSVSVLTNIRNELVSSRLSAGRQCRKGVHRLHHLSILQNSVDGGLIFIPVRATAPISQAFALLSRESLRGKKFKAPLAASINM